MDLSQTDPTVAVIGLGACGLATTKNLLEAGFNVTAFDSNDYVGGLWQYSDDPAKVSVLKTTVSNVSRHAGCFTDFPFAEGTNDYPTAAEQAKYLNAYADGFNLRPHFRLHTKITRVSRHNDGWQLAATNLTTKEASIFFFDKVVFCVGPSVQRPSLPAIKGMQTAAFKTVHSNAYKSPAPFASKRVVVVGLGNSGADIACDLADHANGLWLSHRRGNAILSRRPNGRPLDHTMSMQLNRILGFVARWLPGLSETFSSAIMNKLQSQCFKLRPEWNLGPAMSLSRRNPVINDELVPYLESGKLKTKPALVAIDGNKTIFADGSELEDIDAVIFATGFRADYSVLDPSVDPTRNTRADWYKLPGAHGRPLPRLYQGILSLDHPESLAFLGQQASGPQGYLNFDISSCAVAQIWSGKSALPSIKVMEAHVEQQHDLVCSLARTGEVYNTNHRNQWEWLQWCDEAAGIGLVKRFGLGWEAWRYWLQDRKMSALIARGLHSPHLFRLFDEGKRKSWPNAHRMVIAVNQEAKEMKTK